MMMKKSRRNLAIGSIIMAAPLLLGSECDSSGFGAGGVIGIIDAVAALVLGILQVVL